MSVVAEGQHMGGNPRNDVMGGYGPAFPVGNLE
jgi:hypothetical protein